MRFKNVLDSLNGILTPSEGDEEDVDSLVKPSRYAVSRLNKGQVLLCTLGFLLLVFFQEAVFNHLRLFGVKPNLAMVFVFLISIGLTPRTAMLYGACCGLYLDLFYGRFLGIYALQLMYFALLISCISLEKFKSSLIWTISLSAPAFLLYTILESVAARFLLMFSTGATLMYENYGTHMMNRILPVVLYDLIVFFILVLPVRLLWKRLKR